MSVTEETQDRYLLPSPNWAAIQREPAAQRALVAAVWPVDHLPRPAGWPLEADVAALLRLTTVQLDETREIQSQAREYARGGPSWHYRPERRGRMLRTARDARATRPVLAAVNTAGDGADIGGYARRGAVATAAGCEVLLSLHAAACEVRRSLYEELDGAFGRGRWTLDSRAYAKRPTPRGYITL